MNDKPRVTVQVETTHSNPGRFEEKYRDAPWISQLITYVDQVVSDDNVWLLESYHDVKNVYEYVFHSWYQKTQSFKS